LSVFGTWSSRSSDSEISEIWQLSVWSNDPIEIESKSNLEGIKFITCNLTLTLLLFFSMSSKLFNFTKVPTIWWRMLFSFLEPVLSSQDNGCSEFRGYLTTIFLWTILRCVSTYCPRSVKVGLLASSSLFYRIVSLYGFRFKIIATIVNRISKQQIIIPMRRLRFSSAIVLSFSIFI
jgi:hypothetical protein